jgi:hypothetical protein
MPLKLIFRLHHLDGAVGVVWAMLNAAVLEEEQLA